MTKARVRRIKKQVIQEQVQYSKSIFHSSTFWGATLMAFIPICAVAYDGVKKGFNDSHAAILTSVLAGYGITLQGRIKANDSLPVHTPNGLPGANAEDFEPKYMEGNDYINVQDASGYIPDKSDR